VVVVPCTNVSEAANEVDAPWLIPCAPALSIRTFGTFVPRPASIKSAAYGQISYVVVVTDVVVVVVVLVNEVVVDVIVVVVVVVVAVVVVVLTVVVVLVAVEVVVVLTDVVVVLSTQTGGSLIVLFLITTSLIGSHSVQHVSDPLIPSGIRNPSTSESAL